MPPPSPVWAWDYQNKGQKVFCDTTFALAVNIDGVWYRSKDVLLKVKQTPPKEEKKEQKKEPEPKKKKKPKDGAVSTEELPHRRHPMLLRGGVDRFAEGDRLEVVAAADLRLDPVLDRTQ
jgi:hypothetical protein